MKDNLRHKGLRKNLAKLLKVKGIVDKNVLRAVEAVPRHLFLDSAFAEIAYEDKAFPIGEGQTISQPFTVAYQTEKLELKPGMKVLEIGTGSGYQACILSEMQVEVYTIERNQKLYRTTKPFLQKLGYKIKAFYGDGSKGLPTFAPYDRILVTAGAPSISQSLTEQLTVGGVMVIPVGDEKRQKMFTVQKISETEIVEIEHEAFRFVPLIGDQAW